MKETNKIVGKRLRTLRNCKGISQEYIANCLNVRTATISEIENGKRSIRVDLLFGVCSILNITLKDFFDFSSTSQDSEACEIIREINSEYSNMSTENLNIAKKMAYVLNGKL